jgi:hypothetical protein
LIFRAKVNRPLKIADAIGTRLPIPPPGLFPFAESSLQNELFQQTRFLILKLKNTIFIKVNLSSTLL